MAYAKQPFNRRNFLKLAVSSLGGAVLACGRGQPDTATGVAATSDLSQPAARPSPTPGPTSSPRGRIITANDFVPEQTNYVDTIVVAVNYSTRRDQALDMQQAWDKIFGLDDPIGQLNAYYREIFYGQMQLRPVEIAPQGYMEVELPGTPQDYAFGWLIGLEDEDIASLDPDEAEQLVLEVMSRAVEKYPEVNFQDKFIIMILNALGSEYGRGAAGALPTGGAQPVYDLFIGNLGDGDLERFADPECFRTVGESKVVGLIRHTGYTFDDYFRDRGEVARLDQFLLGIGLFGKDAPLSCAVHDILHGLRRKSAYADPPEGRARAVNCLYNLPLQSQWLLGSEEHGRFDRSVNVSPYIGWWDPMGDHLHPAGKPEFFASYPHGMCSYTRLNMGLIPARCIAVAEADEVSVRLAPLSNPTLPPAGADPETLAVRVPLMPELPDVAHIYLLLEYRRRVEGRHADNFTIDPEYAFGDPRWDPGYNVGNPAESHYVNPPMQFVSKEGVLVYLVNEKIPPIPTVTYQPEEWFKYTLVLLNPAGNEKRDDLTQAALAAGESLRVDFRSLYPTTSAPIQIVVTIDGLSQGEAQVRIVRERLG